jgi:hypothetical protein
MHFCTPQVTEQTTPSYYISIFLIVSISLKLSFKYLLFVCAIKSSNVSLTPHTTQQGVQYTNSTRHWYRKYRYNTNVLHTSSIIHTYEVLLVCTVRVWCTAVFPHSKTRALKHTVPVLHIYGLPKVQGSTDFYHTHPLHPTPAGSM